MGGNKEKTRGIRRKRRGCFIERFGVLGEKKSDRQGYFG